MKLIIDISEDDFLSCKHWLNEGVAQWAETIIVNGTPLPKGRGRQLIDNVPTIEPRMTNKELKSIKTEDYRRTFTIVMCGDCKYADVPRNRKPCCSCEWLERECYYEEANND